MNQPLEVQAQTEEAERAVLSAAFLAPEWVPEMAALLGREDFHRSAYAHVFGAIVSLAKRHDAIDPVTVKAELVSCGHITDDAGGRFVDLIAADVPMSGNYDRYAKMVREASLRRQGARMLVEVAQSFNDQTVPVDDSLARADAAVRVLMTRHEGQKPLRKIGPEVRALEARLKKNAQSKRDVLGLSTGLVDFDRQTNGLRPGHMIVIAGLTGSGKTSLAMNFASHVACVERRPVLVFEQEMSAEQLAERIAAGGASIDGHSLQSARLTEPEWERLARAADRYDSAPLILDDTSSVSQSEIRARARRVKHEHGDLSLIVLDYIQISAMNKDIRNREQQVAEMSRGMKQIAREFNCPVLVLAQLNRGPDQGQREARLSDLRESGAIEQDADLVCFVNRRTESTDQATNITIAKNRHGACGKIDVTFIKEFSRFESYSPRTNEERRYGRDD